MKKLLGIVLLMSFLITQGTGQDAFIQAVVDRVSGDSIFATIAELQDMERYTQSNDPEPVDYITAYLERFGCDTVYLQQYREDWSPNIVAVKYGEVYPDSIYVLGGHYDTYFVGLPGADDNASGTSGVMEAVRVLSDYEFDKTIQFVLFSGEELGLWGSEAFVEEVVDKGDNVVAMLNLDMIAYVNEGDELNVSIAYNNISVDLLDRCINSMEDYVPGLSYVADSVSILVTGSDHKSFWDAGIPALFFIDEIDTQSDNFNSYMHSMNDTLGLSANSDTLAEWITQTAVATMAELAGIENTPAPENEKYEDIVFVRPNPTTGKVYVDLNQFRPDAIEVYNIYGQRMYYSTLFNPDRAIDMSGYSSGVYIIIFRNSESGRIVRVVKE